MYEYFGIRVSNSDSKTTQEITVPSGEVWLMSEYQGQVNDTSNLASSTDYLTLRARLTPSGPGGRRIDKVVARTDTSNDATTVNSGDFSAFAYPGDTISLEVTSLGQGTAEIEGLLYARRVV